jgi:hypothetical protein
LEDLHERCLSTRWIGSNGGGQEIKTGFVHQ